MTINNKNQRTCLVKSSDIFLPLENRATKIVLISQALKHKDSLDEFYCEFHLNMLYNYCECNKGQCNELPCISDRDFK